MFYIRSTGGQRVKCVKLIQQKTLVLKSHKESEDEGSNDEIETTNQDERNSNENAKEEKKRNCRLQ